MTFVLFPYACDPAGLVQITETPESRNTKKLPQKKYKIPLPGWGPKIRKNYRKNKKKGEFWAIFVFFRKFFRIFGPQLGKGDFVFFFRNFFIFSGLRGFCNLYQARRVATLCPLFDGAGTTAIPIK